MDCDENSIETKQDSNRFPNWKLFIRNLPTFLPVCFLHAWQLAWMTAVYSLPPSKSTPDQYPSPICSSYILLLFWARCMSAFHCFYLWFFCGETLWVFFLIFFFCFLGTIWALLLQNRDVVIIKLNDFLDRKKDSKAL